MKVYLTLRYIKYIPIFSFFSARDAARATRHVYSCSSRVSGAPHVARCVTCGATPACGHTIAHVSPDTRFLIQARHRLNMEIMGN